MARLLKGEKMTDPPRVRRTGYKIKGSNEKKNSGVRATRYTVPSDSVASIASKFNAIVVEDEQKGRAILKKKLIAGHLGTVRETVLKFEGLQGTKVVLVRKNSSNLLEKSQLAEKMKGEAGPGKPETRPKPSIDRKCNARYVRKDFKELLSKEKRFSLPKTHLLDEVFNDDIVDQVSTTSTNVIITTQENIIQDSKIEEIKLSIKPHEEEPKFQDSVDLVQIQIPIAPNSSSLHRAKPANIVQNSSSEYIISTMNDIHEKSLDIPSQNDVSEYKSSLYKSSYLKAQNHVNLTPDTIESIYGNHEIIIANECMKISQTIINKNELTDSQMSIQPNNSFLWSVKIPQDSSMNDNEQRTTLVEDKENQQLNRVEDEFVENKENVEKLETPVIRTVDKKGYGRINVQANPSSLYRNLIGQMKERLEAMEKNETKTKEMPKEETKERPPNHVEYSERGYEVIDETYEVVGYENNYDEIGSFHRTEDRERLYDDVTLQSEQIYESIYNGSRLHNDSDSSSDVQSNSLYEHRPPSEASSGGSGAVIVRASRSDTSDEWVDIELDTSEEQIVVLEGTPRTRPEGWSVKVRRQWSTRSSANRRILTVAITSTSGLYLKYDHTPVFEREEHGKNTHPLPLITYGLVSLRDVWFSGHTYEVQEVTIFISSKDSDSSSKHYELVDNRDDDSAVCDDFDDSSDSEFSVINNFKPNVEERLQPEGNQTDGLYGLMKKMRKTSSTIGKSLRRISRMSKTTSAQDIFSSSNGRLMIAEYAKKIFIHGLTRHDVQFLQANALRFKAVLVQKGVSGLSRGKWPSLKKKIPQATSTFYLNEANTLKSPPPRPPPPDPRRLSITARPTSPPPPPPINHNGDTKGKAINDTSLYAECGLFEQNPALERRNHTNSWYSDIGLYENSKSYDTASEHGSSQGSDMDLRFADEPLYQFYTERVAKQELSEELSETGYEEIGENRNPQLRPSALDLVSPEMNRTLWCQVPQVIASGILDTLTPERKRLQEAKFEVVTSEASYYKSLTILEKHFAASPLLKDESVLPKVHYKTLFGNVSSVRKCSEAVLAALEKCWQESILLEGLSNVINEVAEKHFAVYKKYCTSQLAIERTVKSLRKTNPAFAEALDTLQNSPKCHNLAFYSFVLLPMQRITRMPLLQDAILTKLTTDDSEYESCRLALARLNKIVHECNEAARQSDRMEEMMLLSRAITFPPDVKRIPLLSASRWLVRSGDLSQVPPEPKTTFGRKLTTPRNTKLRFFLFTDYLVVTKKKGEDYQVVTYCERNLVQMTDVEDPIPNRFLIMLTLLKNHEGKTQEMVMCCGGESSRARWISALSPPSPSIPGERLYEDWDCPQVCSTHPYLPSQPDELQLQNGDVINVLRKTVDGWYYGERMRDEEKGWFPGNHTVEILSSHVRARNLKQRYRLLALSSNFIQKQHQQNNKSIL